jgi:RNA polymerase sigma factor (sigma-70 family)
MREQDFERLYEEHAAALFSFLAYRTGDRALAEDLLADTFERALRRRRTFDRRKASEKTWLYTIALNLMRDHHRRAAAESNALERSGREEPASAAAHERVETQQTVAQALEVLSAHEREAIALRFGGGMSVPDIAKVTGEPLPTVEGRVYRALRKLRDALGPEP